MSLPVHKRLLALLLPMLLPVLGLVLAAEWLGYSVAAQIARSPEQSPDLAEIGLAVLPALLMLLLLGVMAHMAARKALMPWVLLAQTVQARSPKDLRPIPIAPHTPADVQVMAEAKELAESDAAVVVHVFSPGANSKV